MLFSFTLPGLKLKPVSISEKYQRSIIFRDFGNKAFLRWQIKFQSVSHLNFNNGNRVERHSIRIRVTHLFGAACVHYSIILCNFPLPPPLPPPPHPEAYDSMIQYMPISHKTHLYLNNVNLIQHVFVITHEVSLFGLVTPSWNESWQIVLPSIKSGILNTQCKLQKSNDRNCMSCATQRYFK